ncbi:MAG TPA: IS21 family transposase [Bryobacteraceae bacterium]|nr:IS21 family transposase [Bryobacteraceae bacterium]
MRKIHEILRLHFEQKLGQRQIARSANVSQSTVHDYLVRAEHANLAWPLAEDWDETRLEVALFPSAPAAERPTKQPLPDFAALGQQREQHRDLTLELLWEEYRQQHPDGFSYPHFCKLYRRWRKQQDVVLRQEHRPGEKLFLDWAGATIPIYAGDGTVHAAPLFVSALGVSSYTYAEAVPNQQMENWLKVQMNALEFYGGCPQLLIPDNTKTGVSRACLYEPDLNPTYQEFAAHYHLAVMPARPRKPRDKAKVESAVQVVQRWIVMCLRHRRFLSLAECNQAIRELLGQLNQRPFRKRRDESRASLFAKVDRPALRPLPAQRYDLSQWAQARVNIDYHIAFDGNFYSVPYTLTGEVVDVRSTPATVEIFHRSERVASHLRSRGRNQPVTQADHRPKSHQAHLEWTPSRMVEWAGKVGPHTAQLVQRILEAKPHPEMGYRACLGLIRLARKHSPERMEAAAVRAITTGAIGYRHVKSILENRLDSQPLAPPPPRITPDHENLRGPEYFQ